MNKLKNRTFLGILCIVLALILAFLVAPFITKLSAKTVKIVKVTRDVPRGHVITAADVEESSVGATGLPDNVVKDKSKVIGTYATTDLKKGDFILPSKFTDDSSNATDVFYSLDGTKQAISVSIASFAGGLSGKLENGDVVRVIYYEGNKSEMPVELTYVRVVTTTTAEGIDRDEVVKNEDGTVELPSTVTLLVNADQAKQLVNYENEGKIHLVLVQRGAKEQAKCYLDAQDGYFTFLAKQASGEIKKNEVYDVVGTAFANLQKLNAEAKK